MENMTRIEKLAIVVLFVLVTACAYRLAVGQDWDEPTLTSTYTSVISALKDRDDAIATMDYSDASNFPVGVIRWNDATGKFEKWSGTAWTVLQATLHNHVASTSNPHSVTATQVGAASAETLNSHVANLANPHNVTALQLGAARTNQNLDDLSNKTTARSNLGAASSAALTALEGTVNGHTSSTSNPHSVTATQVGALKISNNLSDVQSKATSRSNIDAAKSGANTDITSLSGLTSITSSGTNLTLQSNIWGSHVDIRPSSYSAYRWRFAHGGKIVPPDSKLVYYTPWPSGHGGYTVTRSLNPAVATSAQCAHAWNTLVDDLIQTGIIQKVP